MNKKTFYPKYGKRIFDICLSGSALVILSPVMGGVALLVKVKLGSPVIFKQKRPGRYEKNFTMYKFRTMTDETDLDGNLLSDEKRLTNFGQLLRSTSLDELPELWNILKGDMSIVGPRPLLIEYLSLYNEEQKKRHSVKPGLTGLAQTSGRNLISWNEKLELDCKYISDINLKNDLKIIMKTFIKVFIKEGISSEKSFTMEKFTGEGK